MVLKSKKTSLKGDSSPGKDDQKVVGQNETSSIDKSKKVKKSEEVSAGVEAPKARGRKKAVSSEVLAVSDEAVKVKRGRKKAEAVSEEKDEAKVVKKTAKASSKVVKAEADRSDVKSKAGTRGKAKKERSSRTLIIVESPTKAKSLSKMLGSNFVVRASVGHIFDLPKSRLAIDVENNFEPEYILVKGKSKIKSALISAAEDAGSVLLASDPDREGEAIAWHLANMLKIDPASSCRVRIHEITKDAVKAAVGAPEPIDMNKVDAQQARRVLDRLVGYTLSPLLWRKVKRGLSAGRVQSVAMAIICDREDEILAFVPVDYWSISALGEASDGRRYLMRVEKENGRSLLVDGKPLKIDSAEKAAQIRGTLESKPLVVSSCVSKEGIRKAPSPFKTSTLQQEAARRLGFSPKRTMRTAQSLFEGVSVPGRGLSGLITYMRTDSLRFAPEAVSQMRGHVEERFGKAYVPARPHVYDSGKNAQDAHEAIRPTDVSLLPGDLKEFLSPDQFKLYDLIWRRSVASQMSHARVDTTSIEGECGVYGLKGHGVVVTFDGWGAVWPLEVKDNKLEMARAGEVLSVVDVEEEAKQTRPPSRYTESSLIKKLEDVGVGRPSTYASIVETLYSRDYVRRDEERKLTPSPLGMVVNNYLLAHFSAKSKSPIVNVGFTADMESSLDLIEKGKEDWVHVVDEFWEPFVEAVGEAQEGPSVPPPPDEPTGEMCPECGKPLIKKRGRFGDFIGCSGYPECHYLHPVQVKLGIPCPKCGDSSDGEVIQRKSKRGTNFYGCSRYPACDYASWNRPSENRCPECGGLMEFKGRATTAVCTKCGYKADE